jgi:hypothetical protein
MASLNKPRYIEFRIVDIDDNPITARALTSTTVGQRVLVFFTRDTVACSDPVTLVNWGNGRYYATYTPTATGHDYIEIFDELYDLRFIDAEDIVGEGTDEQTSDVVSVTQDYTSVGRLKVTQPNPQRFNLLVFNSFDWQSGRTNSNYSIIGTAIDASGNWVTPVLTLLPDTYHFVIMATDTDEVKVIAPFLKVVR